ADFGLARLLEAGQTVEASMVAGTGSYMAPEVWQRKASERSDQYSLAVTYVELRRGRRPYAGQALADLMRQHCGGFPDPTGVPDAERKVLARALSTDRVHRFASCGEFANALRAALVSQPAAKPAPGRSVALVRLLFVATFVGLLGVLAYLAYNWVQH